MEARFAKSPAEAEEAVGRVPRLRLKMVPWMVLAHRAKVMMRFRGGSGAEKRAPGNGCCSCAQKYRTEVGGRNRLRFSR